MNDLQRRIDKLGALVGPLLARYLDCHDTLVYVLVFISISYAIYWVHRKCRSKDATRTRINTLPTVPSGKAVGHSEDADNRNRPNGEWTPQHSTYPEITPCKTALNDIQVIPYRPFRWGAYHVTMGIRTMPWSEWIELDSKFVAYQQIRDARLRTGGKSVLQVLPSQSFSPLRAGEDNREGHECVNVTGGAEAARELVYELAEFLSRRYPLSFKVSRVTSSPSTSLKDDIATIEGIPLAWHGLMPIKAIHVVDTGITYSLSTLEAVEDPRMGEEALKFVNGLTQDDFAIMVEDRTASITSRLNWSSYRDSGV